MTSKVKYSRESIMKRMKDVYRLWRFLRIVRKCVFDGKPSLLVGITDDTSCIYEFTKLRKLNGRKYNIREAVVVLTIAKIGSYIKMISEDGEEHIGINEKGVTHSTHTALVNDLANSVISVSPLVAILIALLALYVSITKK